MRLPPAVNYLSALVIGRYGRMRKGNEHCTCRYDRLLPRTRMCRGVNCSGEIDRARQHEDRTRPEGQDSHGLL